MRKLALALTGLLAACIPEAAQAADTPIATLSTDDAVAVTSSMGRTLSEAPIVSPIRDVAGAKCFKTVLAGEACRLNHSKNKQFFRGSSVCGLTESKFKQVLQPGARLKASGDLVCAPVVKGGVKLNIPRSAIIKGERFELFFVRGDIIIAWANINDFVMIKNTDQLASR